MKMLHKMASVSAAGLVTLAFSGVALADTATISGPTGPDSTNEVTIDNSSDMSITNTTNTQIVNANLQSAESGNASANENTTVGNVGSGNANNSNTTSTSVSVNNTNACSCNGSGGNGSGDPGSGNGGSGNGGNVGGGSGAGGSVLGASTGGKGAGVGVLPSVGASQPVDVSALRALYQPKTDAPTSNLVAQTHQLSFVLLSIAALMSLIGAVGTAVYTNRRERLINQ